MGGGAAIQGQTGADPRPGPAVLGHPRESPPRPRHGFREMASLPIPDELVAEIFLRLPTTTDLIRASAACVSFRCVTTGRSFLRRFRKLHAPPFLGFLDHQRKFFHPAAPPHPSAPAVFHPAAPPHPSAPAASATALAADFSFSFLPAPARDWRVQDSRDGRVLLDRSPHSDVDTRHELVVCDPLHRRYLLLPPIPAHLTATVERPLPRSYLETFLAPPVVSDSGEALAAEETSFTMVWMAQCSTKLVTCVFSSSTGEWRSISSQSWGDLLKPGPWSKSNEGPHFSGRQHVYGCFYWVSQWMEKLLVLDIERMEFSITYPPPDARGLNLDLIDVDIAFVEAGEGRLGIFICPELTNDLKYFIRQNNCGSSCQWQFERTVSPDSGFSIMGSTERHLFLCRSSSLGADFFSLDVKTLQLERVFVTNLRRPCRYTYSNFPPSLLSTPTISSGKLSGVEKEAEKEMLEQGCAASSSAQSSQPSE